MVAVSSMLLEEVQGHSSVQGSSKGQLGIVHAKLGGVQAVHRADALIAHA